VIAKNNIKIAVSSLFSADLPMHISRGECSLDLDGMPYCQLLNNKYQPVTDVSRDPGVVMGIRASSVQTFQVEVGTRAHCQVSLLVCFVHQATYGTRVSGVAPFISTDE